jgi:hypothetical protein
MFALAKFAARAALTCFIGSAAVGVSSVPSSAALFNVTYAPFAPGIQGTGAGFESLAVGPLASGYSEAGLTFTPLSGSVRVKNNTDSTGAFPFGDTSTRYVSVLGGASLSIAVGAPKTRTTFYWGSIDSYNTVELLSGSTLVGSLTGGDIPPLIGNGNQSSFASNRLISIFLTNGTFDTIRFSSGLNSFEFDRISAGVPEPSTWAMMLIGFAGLAFVSRRRNAASSAGHASV